MKCKKCKKEKPDLCFQAKRSTKKCKMCDNCRSLADARGGGCAHRSRGEDAQTAEGARLEAGEALVEGGLRRRTAQR
eukprot:3325924-Prymnesium_polylepis.1